MTHLPTVRAEVVQVARLPFPGGDGGSTPTPRLHFTTATAREVAPLLAQHHYLGPLHRARYGFAGWVDDELVACQLWVPPTARMLPADGSLIELARWCLIPAAGDNAGSRMMGWVRRQLRRMCSTATHGVSYSDLTRHTGALYRASGWEPWPTHHAERFMANGVGYPSGHGRWANGRPVQAPKMRWRIALRPGSPS